MSEMLSMEAIFSSSPREIFLAWLDSEAHSRFTGSPAKIDARVGGAFTVWDGYICGVTLALREPEQIVQSWRTTEFPEGSPDSRLELQFEPAEQGTRLRLVHTMIPDGQAAGYRQGWIDYYFSPMQHYFLNKET